MSRQKMTDVGKDLLEKGQLDLAHCDVWVGLTMDGQEVGPRQKLQNQRVYASEGGGVFHADDVSWNIPGTLQVNGCILYSDAPWGAGVPIATFDFGTTHALGSGDMFTIKWESSGIIRLGDELTSIHEKAPKPEMARDEKLLDALETFWSLHAPNPIGTPPNGPEP